MAKQKILSFGSVYLDINGEGFDLGDLQLGKEYVGDRYVTTAGGSAVNSAKTLSLFGMGVVFIGKTGDDIFSRRIKKDLISHGVTPVLINDDKLKTNVGINLADKKGEAIMFVLGSANENLRKDDLDDKIKKLISTINLIYIGGIYKLKNLGLDYYENLINFSHTNHVSISLDHGRIPADLPSSEKDKIRSIIRSLDENDYYFPSKTEYMELWGNDIHKYPDGLSVPVVLKSGEKGSVYLDSSGSVSMKAIQVEQINTVGAGDVFNAAYIYASSNGKDIEDSLRFANVAGAMKVSGRKIKSIEDVDKFITKV